MRIAVISDVHGNLEALTEVLRDIDDSGVQAVYSLGDQIGYGPDSDAVVKEILKRRIPSVIGNHDLAAIDARHLSWFNPVARRSLVHSIASLSQVALDGIGQMPPTAIWSDCLCVHGFPPDSISTYRFEISKENRLRIMSSMPVPVCFIGHTHELAILASDGTSVTSRPIKEGEITLSKANRYIINVGSVGQPRDGDNNAKYVIWDTENYSLHVRYIPYDIAAVAEKIIAAGLPRSHANRLW